MYYILKLVYDRQIIKPLISILCLYYEVFIILSIIQDGVSILTSEVVQVVAIQLTLKRGHPHSQHVLMLGWQEFGQRCIISSLGERQIRFITISLD